MLPVKVRARFGLALGALVALVLGTGIACGRVTATGSTSPTNSSPARLSPTPTGPASTTPPPDPNQVTASNCAGPAPSTAPRSLQGYYTVRVVSSWADTGDYVHTETLLLELTAPSNYGYAPTRIQLHSDVGPVHTVYGAQATSHSIAVQKATTISHELASP